MFTLRYSLITAVMPLLIGINLTAASPTQQPVTDRAAAISLFEERVRTYASLHRRFQEEVPMPATAIRSLLAARAKVASAIKVARPNAQQGDIFTTAVADLFRGIIAEALEGVDTEAFLRDLYEEHETKHGFHPRVYEPYPDWGTHEMPIVLLLRLPPLPEEIQYRLLDHDLVLWDTYADLIIDFLPDAIPRFNSNTRAFDEMPRLRQIVSH